jgi:hypothetical protein
LAERAVVEREAYDSLAADAITEQDDGDEQP